MAASRGVVPRREIIEPGTDFAAVRVKQNRRFADDQQARLRAAQSVNAVGPVRYDRAPLYQPARGVSKAIGFDGQAQCLEALFQFLRQCRFLIVAMLAAHQQHMLRRNTLIPTRYYCIKYVSTT